MLGRDLFKSLLDKGGGILGIPPDLHRGVTGKGYLQHDLHKLVQLYPVSEVRDQVILDLFTNLLSFLGNFLHSFHRDRRR